MTTILFPARPGTREVDSSFQGEFDAALRAGFSTALVDEGEMAFGGDVRLVGLPKEIGQVIYRGWLLRLSDYERLADFLTRRGFSLLTSPVDYRNTYHLPEWYKAVHDTGLTPRSIWFPGAQFDVAEVADLTVAEKKAEAPLFMDIVAEAESRRGFDETPPHPALYLDEPAETPLVESTPTSLLRNGEIEALRRSAQSLV